MAQTLIDSGVYDAREVSHLLARNVDTIVRWSTADRSGRPPIVAPSLDRAFSFVDLVSLAVVRELRQRAVNEVDVRKGVAWLRQETGHKEPLAHREVIDRLGTSGRSFLWEIPDGWYDIGKGGQGTFKEVVKLYFKKLSYDTLGVAEMWRPAPLIVLNPRIQAGAPCIEGTRVTTGTVASMLVTDSIDVVAEDLDLSLDQVRAAADFEKVLTERGLAA